MSTLGLTRGQRDCMRVIQELTDGACGISPSYVEIAHELGLSSRSLIVRLVDCLEERGYLRRAPNQARSLTVLQRVPMAEDDEIINLFDNPDLAACLTGKRHVAP
jgi:SOS-response transcriptional repressor LexA